MTTAYPTLPKRARPIDPITVDQYHQMIDSGAIDEGAPFELLHGVLVRKDLAATGEDPVTIGDRHALVVNKLAALNIKLYPLGCFLQTQQPILIPPFDEPEPDAALILGTPDDHPTKPTTKSILAVIEVADSSLHRDRTEKLRIYAQARLPLYLLINLVDNCIEQYTRPLPKSARYSELKILSPKHAFSLPLPKNKSLKLPVASLLA